MIEQITFRQRAEKLGLNLSSAMTERFVRYSELLAKWNKRVNLTALEESSYEVLHFLDSLSVASVIENISQPLRLIDVGSGAGFPGVPLKIAFPLLQLTLVESNNKKIRFLESLCAELAIDAKITHVRAEMLAHHPAERAGYDVAVARALGSKAMTAEILLPFLSLNGCAVLMLGKQDGSMDSEFQSLVDELGGRIEKIHPSKLEVAHEPKQEVDRCLVLIRKYSATPVRYPRSAARLQRGS